ncbi:hypothetical protein Cycma_0797 [Cyclobacterium marinum DSM 745]|uniref:Uncharacterized protein n=1 Tax=Cyclobacterium marinum (strain ATCC 25205 / DSM 745 / LMG 13164 / NCIMB 1802) TaxID=880070 RepID=G0J262_CYCMS|nr:hypothetical protein Cycma_0797 [Cyclobacterium marinum DSM 745]
MVNIKEEILIPRYLKVISAPKENKQYYFGTFNSFQN